MINNIEIWKFENLKIWENPEKSGKKFGNRIKIRIRRLSYHIWEVNHKSCEETWSKPLKSEDLRKIRKNPGKNLKPDKKIIISYLRSKSSILWKNMVKANEIWSFEKCDQRKKRKKKEIFILWSFAHEFKTADLQEIRLLYFYRSLWIHSNGLHCRFVKILTL